MGIQGLRNYFDRRHRYYYESHELHNTKLIIDGINLACQLFAALDASHHLGVKYDIYGEIVNNFFDNLALCNVDPIIIMDGKTSMTGEKSQKDSDATKSKRNMRIPYLVRHVFMIIVRKRKITMVQIIGKAAATIATIAEEYNCPALTNDGNFHFYETTFIPWFLLTRDVRFERTGSTVKHWLVCKSFKLDNFLEAFKFHKSLLPLALVILGDKRRISLLPPHALVPFFSRLRQHYENQNEHKFQRRIENTLRWLSNFSSMNEAVGELLRYINKKYRMEILGIVEKKMNNMGMPSPEALRALNLPEERIEEIIAEKSLKLFKFDGDVDQLESIILEGTEEPNREKKEEEEDEHDADVEEVEKWNERKLVSLLPHWIIEDYSSGALSTTLMKLFMRPRKSLVPQIDDDFYPPSATISIPIITAIYSLVMTLREAEESELRFHIVNGEKVEVEVVKVVKSSLNLRRMKGIKLPVRSGFIDDVLGVSGDKLDELPEEWRLYVATVIFWMRQKIPPKKTEIHLFSVLFSMLIGVIDKKIGLVRSRQAFDQKFGEIYENARRTRTKAMRVASLGELIEKVSTEECVLALPFFIKHIPTGRKDDGVLPWYWKTVVHTFSQLHSLLKCVMDLNEVLNYPYVQISIPEVYNGGLFYGLFEDFSNQSDFESFLSIKLEYSPNILKMFRFLRKLVVGMLAD